MHAVIDLNRGSGFVYGRDPGWAPLAARVNAFINAALEAADRKKPPRDYLGASRIGEPCARRLVYEYTRTPPDEGKAFAGTMLRIFEAGHQFEDLSIRWLREAGFDLRIRNRAGEQFGFSIAGGRIRGHIDGVILGGPDIGIAWPCLWEHKALKAKSWTEVVKRGVRASKPVYFAQAQLYMAYMEVATCLFTAMNKDTQELHHELLRFDPAEAQALSDKAVRVIRAAEAGELLPRIAAHSDFHHCRFCPFAKRCWEKNV